MMLLRYKYRQMYIYIEYIEYKRRVIEDVCKLLSDNALLGRSKTFNNISFSTNCKQWSP